MTGKPKLPALLILAIACLLMLHSSAQTIPLKGTVTDTLNKTALLNAVVYIKNPKDSSLVGYTRANEKGLFEMQGISPGHYIMVVMYPGYVDWIDSIIVNAKERSIEVSLTTKAHLLQEVIVKQVIAPIRIKGDTTEYLADSFHVKPGATVEAF